MSLSVVEKLTKLIKFLLGARLKTYVKAGVVTMVIWFIWKNRGKKHGTIPMRPGFLPIIGHLHILLELHDRRGMESLDFFTKDMLESNSSALCSHGFALQPAIYLLDPKLIKFVFETKFEDFMKTDQIRLRLEPLLGDGIFSSDPPQWRQHRKVGSKMFSMRNLKNYMFDVAKRGNERWLKKIEELRLKNNEIDIYDLLAIYTLDVFVEIAFGESLNIIEAIPNPHPFSVAFDDSLHNVTWRFRVPFWRFFRYFQILHEKKLTKNVKEINKFANNMINNTFQKNKGKLSNEFGQGQHNILSLFLETNPNLTKKELKDIAMNFIIAGRDTTRITLSWFFYLLSKKENSDVLSKIYNEIDNFYKNEKELTYKNIQNVYVDDKSHKSKGANSYFNYLEAALCETLRLYPAVQMLVRYAVRDVELPGNEKFVIKKGNAVIIPTYTQGRNKKLWGEDAEIFKPERFLSKGVLSYAPHIFPAFNIAPRLCLGRHVAIMEAKLVSIGLFRRYTFEAINHQNVKKAQSLVLNMENGFKIRLFPRDLPKD